MYIKELLAQIEKKFKGTDWRIKNTSVCTESTQYDYIIEIEDLDDGYNTEFLVNSSNQESVLKDIQEEMDYAQQEKEHIGSFSCDSCGSGNLSVIILPSGDYAIYCEDCQKRSI